VNSPLLILSSASVLLLSNPLSFNLAYFLFLEFFFFKATVLLIMIFVEILNLGFFKAVFYKTLDLDTAWVNCFILFSFWILLYTLFFLPLRVFVCVAGEEGGVLESRALMFARQALYTTWAIPPVLFALVSFQIGSCAFCMGWSQTEIQAGSHVAGIAGIHHCTQPVPLGFLKYLCVIS
jgi:hypothetical protein